MQNIDNNFHRNKFKDNFGKAMKLFFRFHPFSNFSSYVHLNVKIHHEYFHTLYANNNDNWNEVEFQNETNIMEEKAKDTKREQVHFEVENLIQSDVMAL